MSLEPCPYDPTMLAGAPIGMLHCPLCGETVIPGLPHPDYSLLDDDEAEPTET
jgi:hypothetical protein